MAASFRGLPLESLHVWKDNSLTSDRFSREWPFDSLFFGGFIPDIATRVKG